MDQEPRECPLCCGTGFLVPSPPPVRKQDKHDYFRHVELKKEKLKETHNFKSGDDIDQRMHLPSSNVWHLCNMICDGQDGINSNCHRERVKLFGKVNLSFKECLLHDDPEALDTKRLKNLICFSCKERGGQHLKDCSEFSS